MIFEEKNWTLVMLCQIVLGPQFQNVYFELLLFNLAHGFRKFGCKPKISKIIKNGLGGCAKGYVFFDF